MSRQIYALIFLIACLASPLAAQAQEERESTPAASQLTPPSAALPAAEEDLYLKAMEAISAGHQDDANAILIRMQKQGSRHAGEWLDLAMVQCALGHAAEAEALFQDIETQFSPPKGILDIIEQQRSDGCIVWAPSNRWSLMLARGIDNNANQGASNALYTIGGQPPLELLPEYLPQGDQYSLFSGDYLRELNQDGDLVFAQLYLRHYDRLSNYDTTSLFGGAEHPWKAGAWRMRSSALGGALTLGGKLYQEQLQLQLRSTPPLSLPEKLDFQLLSGVSYSAYQTLSNFNSTTLELRAILDYHDNPTQMEASVGYLSDHGQHLRPGGNRDGWTARLYGHTSLVEKLQGEIDLNYQNWAGNTEYSPGLIDDRRHQNTLSGRAALIYPIGTSQAIHLEWRQTHNRENISIFQYNSRQIQLSWHWYGP